MSKRKSVIIGLLLSAQSAWAGIDSGGTLTLCGEPLEEWSVPMSQVVGYDRYNAVIEKLQREVPTLAFRLRKVESHSWFYPPCDPGTFADKTLDIPANKAIAYYGDFLVAFEFKLKTMRDPGKALLHEAVRNICHQQYRWPGQERDETNCTLRNSDLIYNKYGNGTMSASELLASLIGDSYNKTELKTDKLGEVLIFLRDLFGTYMPKITASLEKKCESSGNPNSVEVPYEWAQPVFTYANKLQYPAGLGTMRDSLIYELSNIHSVFGVEVTRGVTTLDCKKISNLASVLAKIQSELQGMDEVTLAKRYVDGSVLNLVSYIVDGSK